MIKMNGRYAFAPSQSTEMSESINCLEQGMDVLDQIRSSYESLSRSHKLVAQAVLDDPHWVLHSNVGDIAARVEVSNPTIIRFARSVGCEGLSDFKLKLAGSLAVQPPAPMNGVATAASDGSIAGAALRGIATALTKALAHWPQGDKSPAFGQAVGAIHKARHIMCVGTNAFSTFLAQELQRKLERQGYEATALSDATYQLVAVTTLNADDVLIVVSLSGRMPALMRSVELAKMRGARTIAICYRNTPLAEQANILLEIDPPAEAPESLPVGPLVLQIVTVEALLRLTGFKPALDAGGGGPVKAFDAPPES